MEKRLNDALDAETGARGMGHHNLRHRFTGRTHWVEFHLVFPDELTVHEAHQAATEIERKIASVLKPRARVISHLEPRSAEDVEETWEGR